jgi:Tfp pilus assembly protein PilE
MLSYIPMKKPFTLLELIISVTLIALLIHTLLHFYTQNYLSENKMKQIRTICIEQELTRQRLKTVFSHLSSTIKCIDRNSHLDSKQKNCDNVDAVTRQRDNQLLNDVRYKDSSYESQLTYSFSFDNKVDPDPLLSSKLNAQLFVNNHQELILYIFNKKNNASHSQILMHDVKSINIVSFEKNNKIIKITITTNHIPYILSFICFPKNINTITI